MSFVCRGVTHCSECMAPLKINEFVICENCEKKSTQRKEKANMRKTYKGYELIKEIAEGNIKERNKIYYKRWRI